jgi:translation initiation factor IF-2
MAEVTVSELAKSVGASEERLLTQMKEAGLKHKSADELVSDEEKQVLLDYLKNLHGAAPRDTKKITLKRKKVETLKTGATTGKKTVNVEVRKKRTYVKRSDEEIKAQAEAEKEAERLREDAPKSKSSDNAVDDAEQRRIAALEARRKAEEDDVARREAEVAEKQEAEEAKKRESEEKPKAPEKDPVKEVVDAEVDAEAAAVAAEKSRSSSPKSANKKATEEPEKDVDGPASKKKAGRGRAKVKSESDSKDWRKHSHRPQDFSLHEDEEFEAEERARERAAEVAKIRAKNKHTFNKPTVTQIYEVELPETITVGELAQKMAVKSGELIKQLMKMGEMVTVNQSIDQDTASLLVEEMGHTPVMVSGTELEDKLVEEVKSSAGGNDLDRAPIVTVMGHVDHGKTSLLDYIRKSQVASGEAGGITQHIGAYSVTTDHGKITFLDTPGHAAFSAMRARGADCTDIVILVVAADDGVMPQTEEAVRHAKAAGVPVIVAVNKMDKEGADPERVKNELSQHDVIPEDWGGDVQFIPVSAHTGDGIKELLEAVSLQAELLELKAPSDGPATGVIVESRMEKGRGAVCTTLVQSGTLRKGDILLAGDSFGRVRAMTDETGAQVSEAGPSVPVEILGLDAAPDAGDEFLVVPDERKAREVADFRRDKERQSRQERQRKLNLESMFASMGDGQEKKILSVVLKSDVRGSAEAIQAALLDLGNDEVGVNIVSTGVGGINESDMNLAITTDSIVLGFNVRADGGARKLAEKEGIEIRYYSIIYQLIDEVKQALSGMLDPDEKEEIVGIAEVRDVFRSPKFGAIAGCMVIEGAVHRNKPIRVLRENVVVYEGELESLRRFKDDVNEVRNNTECGIGVKDYTDVQPGDQIEVFDIVKVERTL